MKKDAGVVMLMLSSLILVLLCSLAEAQQPSPTEVAGLVSALEGSASVSQPEAAQLRLFDWVRDGAKVSVPQGATMTLVLLDGSRIGLTGPARAIVTLRGLTATTGSVRVLSPLSSLPHVAPISDREQRGRRAAAVRVRGPRITGLYPSNGAVTSASSTQLAFDVVEGATRYALEVEDETGTRVFQIETTETRVALPPLLHPSRSYYWRVRTVGRIGAQTRGEAEFSTLSSADDEARQALREAVGTTRDAHTLAFLAHIDHGLGLLQEARDGVRAALDMSPGDPNLRAALIQLAQRLQMP